MLWIDDDPATPNASAQLLSSEGFHVDCADSGSGGLDRAQNADYDVIILDLDLPDMSGVTVLRRLRGDGIMVPVLVLTGFGTIQSAVETMKFGAVDFREKPLVGDDLIDAVRAAAAQTGSSDAAVRRPAPDARPDQRAEELLRRLCECFDPVEAPAPGEAPDDGRQELSGRLIRTMLDPDVTGPMFFACSQALRLTLAARQSDRQSLAAKVRAILERAVSASTGRLHPRVLAAIARFEAAARAGTRVREADFADALGVDAGYLGRLLRQQTGLTFRQWRWVARTKLAVRELASGGEQVAQIAYALGYEHPSQLDRDFERLIGVTPREFRRLATSVQRLSPA